MGMILMLVVNGCGSESKGSSSIDIAEYLPSRSFNKEYTDVIKLNGKLENRVYMNRIIVEPNKIITKEDTNLKRIVTINSDEINILLIGDINKSKVYKRHVSKKDEIFHYKSSNKIKELNIGVQVVGEEHIEVEESCILDSILDNYQVYFYEYNNYDEQHDIIKLKCTSNKSINTIVNPEYIDSVSYRNGVVTTKDNIYYIYLQKGLGTVAIIDNDCIVDITNNSIDDTADEDACIGEQYHYILYHSEY